MNFSINSSLHYHANGSSTAICSICCQKTSGQRILSESLTVNREVNRQNLSVGLEANRFVKIDVADAGNCSIQYQACISPSPTLIDKRQLASQAAVSLTELTLPYLSPSRYAPADRMRAVAHDLFGNINTSIEQVLAIEDWLYEHICYQVGSSIEQSWSLDTFETRTGVCRDFAHLGIALCRGLNIPARYVTVYAYQLNPQDFHAVFEAFVGGSWIVIDGTRLAPLNGMIRIATGRDAADTALGCLFGPIQGQGVEVNVQLDPSDSQTPTFSPINRESLRNEGKVLQLS
jgi:transglutaminase-like putative cysteine protease